jgi:hypothetical protein
MGAYPLLSGSTPLESKRGERSTQKTQLLEVMTIRLTTY